MKEIKITGQITDRSDTDNRAIYADCGGVVWMRNYILCDCGGYKVGDRVCITVSAIADDELYYPPVPDKSKSKNPKLIEYER